MSVLPFVVFLSVFLLLFALVCYVFVEVYFFGVVLLTSVFFVCFLVAVLL